MFQNELLLVAGLGVVVSLGVVAWAIYCSKCDLLAAHATTPEDESSVPRHVSADHDDMHWADQPRQGHGAMRGLLSDAQAATAEAEVEKREKQEAAASAAAKHEDVDSKLHAKSLRLQQHKKFE